MKKGGLKETCKNHVNGKRGPVTNI